MPASPSYRAFIEELVSPFGVITIRPMFGGAGVYCNGDVFAFIIDDALWLKADVQTNAAFEAAGAERFVYTQTRTGAEAALPYYTAPEEIFDDEDALRDWMGLALAAARRSAAAKAAKAKQSAKAAKAKSAAKAAKAKSSVKAAKAKKTKGSPNAGKKKATKPKKAVKTAKKPVKRKKKA